MITYIDELKDNELEGKRVLLRLDLNVPIVDGKVRDAYRLERIIETIDFLRHKKAITIIIAHCEGKESTSLVPMWHYLNGYFPVEFSPTYFTPEAIGKLLELKEKGVMLFENLRNNPGEKENDPEFAKKLAQMADIYVNDAFSVSHRKHASIVGVPEYLPHYGGLLLKQEIEHLSKVFHPEHPFVFILGGAKFDTKLPLITKYLATADKVFVGGALANDVFRAEGFEVGKSLVSDGDFGIKEMLTNPKFKTFSDVTVIEGENVSFKKPSEVTVDEYIVDAGPETVSDLRNILSSAKTIVWNDANSIVGGGDTLASIASLDLNHKFSFISTGGGAMLDYLVNETLPGIEALEK
jgi:phosphoglycerate kinase